MAERLRKGKLKKKKNNEKRKRHRQETNNIFLHGDKVKVKKTGTKLHSPGKRDSRLEQKTTKIWK